MKAPLQANIKILQYLCLSSLELLAALVPVRNDFLSMILSCLSGHQVLLRPLVPNLAPFQM
jgi:hypothetical protein